MDKEWIHLPSRLVPEYEEGVQKFLTQARNYAKTREVILCPCKHCKNKKYMKFDQVYDHLIINGFNPSYTIWVFHGETYTPNFQGQSSSRGIQEEEDETREAYNLYKDVFASDERVGHTMSEARDYEFADLLVDAETPLFPGRTTYTKLSAIVTLYNYKSTNGHTDNSFNELLKILGYEKIHACPNDCCLFRNELKDLDSCPKCGSSRWKVDKVTTKVCKGVPEKVLRYFPVIPRLKRMFKSEQKAEDLIWHSNHKSHDHMMRHPVDSIAWDTINHKWPAFASDPRNLRLGLATDGFNPFGDLSSRYSCWPVILVNYNLPPLMCMAKENLMLTLLIPGPKQPGNDIDVYLEPLVEDLKELWDIGVETYDAFSKSVFNMKAILMWTINDFPAYGNLAGCATKGKFGCPICGEGISSMWLKYSRKFAYLGHRRFLAPNHPFRQKKKWFDGNKETKGKPRPLNGLEILNVLKDIENDWGKKKMGKDINNTKKKRKERDGSKKVQKPVQMWKKKSIFFNLPYWSGLLLRHNLDVMHVEKNVCENIIGTMLNLKKKSKDGVNARKDLRHLNIRKELHPQEKGENMYHLPAAPYTLSKKEMDVFCSRLKKIKLPDGYSSNIGNCVSLEERKLIGLKSHDCYVLMQQLLSVALRSLLPKGPRNAIFLLCAFYNELCQRVLDRNRLEQLEENIAETLCMLKRLCEEPSKAEGCIAECYLAEERMRFCSAYIKKAACIGLRSNRNDDLENGVVEGRPISQGKEIILEEHLLQAAHRYVLFNTAEIDPYIQMHIEELKQTDRRFSSNETLLQKRHMETFAQWLSKHVLDNSSDRIQWLAHGPRKHVISYTGYIINGHRFHTIDVGRSTQDSGVSVEADTIWQSSSTDSHTVGRLSYYGVIRDIVLLDYYFFKVLVFRCDWANPGTGIKMDDGFTLVNLHQGLRTFENDPFILASQAKQVFYSRENDESNWYVLLKAPPRSIHNMDLLEEDAYTSSKPLDVSRLEINITEKEPYSRNECEGIDVIDIP
ncbi:uncharacterized protein LOC122011081 [Zingiber officinale]|uniref:uncharacterized protein LOC122011081 n=1 Tax=Zingiber officinale TaxID=94328 RepID=UPI001C4D9335|nr:uncharacterized protein LOC122011081 [Zingiber officinale]